MAQRAIGIVRQSQTREEGGASPAEQRTRISEACERDGLELLRVVEELDVSGGTPLEQRAGLRGAVEDVEAGNADVIVAAYFDRLVRSLRVQGELVERVEARGGRVLALDTGELTNGSAGQWLSGTLLGAVAEHQRRVTKERTAASQARSIARGVPVWPGSPPGYRRAEDGRLEPDPVEAPVVAEAFRMRADGASVKAVHEHLLAHGVVRSFGAVQRYLGSRVPLGEVHHGRNVNAAAHEPIVELDVWARVQRTRVPRGRRTKSDRLLARLDVLRCGSCGGRLSVGSSNGGRYPVYRCADTGRCERKVSISAAAVEAIVVEEARAALAGAEGRASAAQEAQSAATALEGAQEALDGALRAFTGLEDEPAAVERLGELRGARDVARARAERLGGTAAAGPQYDADWGDLSLSARRRLIRAVVASVTIAPGRGDRVTVELFSE